MTSDIIERIYPCQIRVHLILTLLLLNFSLLVSKKQLSKIDNSSFNTTHSARNLGFIIFNEHILPSLIRSHHCLSPAILISINPAVSVLNCDFLSVC